jgi:hypothetical protein
LTTTKNITENKDKLLNDEEYIDSFLNQKEDLSKRGDSSLSNHTVVFSEESEFNINK